MLRSQASTEPSSCSSPSLPSSNVLKALPLVSNEATNDDARVAAQVDLVFEMIATFDADGFQVPPKVTRSEVERALAACDGDLPRAVDDVLSLVAIKTLRHEEQQTLQERHRTSNLDLSDLCSSLGLEPDCSFLRALEQLPATERTELLNTNGAFVQQLLLTLEEEEAEEAKALQNVHPLQYLLDLYPNYKAQVVEDVLECHQYDVQRAAQALDNVRALPHVQSYASVVQNHPQRAQKEPKTAFSSLEFPELQTAGSRPPPKPFFPSQPCSYSNLSTQWKLERLEKRLPSIDRHVLQTTFFLNENNSDATEAALREAYALPLDETSPSWSLTEVKLAETTEEKRTVASERSVKDDWTLVSSKRKVQAAREQLSTRYCDVLASFRRGQHVLAGDRVRELSQARREHREAQREWTHAFFLAHQEHLKQQRPIDLHGLIVMEALWIARAAIEFCQLHRIRRCLLICGVGHHSINGKARILTALQISLTRRHVAYRELHGLVTVFPLRSTATC